MKIKMALDEDTIIPEYAHKGDAGLDLHSRVDMEIPIGESRTFDTGVHIEIPAGYAGLLVAKSGLNVKHDILSTGLIDSGYKGSICVKLYNHGKLPYQVFRGDKISQLVIIPMAHVDMDVVDVSEFEESERGDKGFGSTGK